MANKLGNQLLTRVQNEMARNIADIKRQLSEWLERPESGGIETLRKSMAEISGGLSLMEQNEAVELADAIITGIEGLDQNVNENGVTDLFAEQGAEIASGLLILADYIERLGHSSSGHKESVVQAATAIRTMLGNGEKIRVVAQPFISQDTYQALATEVNKIIEAARNQLEQHVRNPNNAFNAEAIINANHDLISLFQILNLQTPQSLLKQINQMLLTPLSEKQWIEVAEAMILVQETLKQLQENVVAEQVDNYHEAVHAQITHSRQLEIDKLINDTGKQGKTFFESLRKQVLQDETVKQKQPWLDAVKQLANYSAITALVNIRELANQLQQLALLFAEFTVQNDETISKTYVPVIDALVAVEYLFDDLAEVGKVSLQDVSFLAEAVQNIEKICPASARAKSLFIESANMTPSAAEDDAENTGDMQHFKDALGAGLDVLNDDFSTLEAENAEHEEEEPQEEENPPEQKYEAVLQTSASSAHAQDTSDATVIYAGAAVAPHTDAPPAAAHMPAAAAEVDAATDSLTLTAPAKTDEAAHEDSTTLGAASGQSQASAEGKGSGAAYFANKTLRDLDKLEIPAEKEAFIASHSDAVVDEEIREFFSEELGEIVALMNDTYPKWREDSADTQLTGDIRRAFHTLKGSGRTVGYEALGEFAWQHEQLLNRVIEKDFSANSLVCDTVGDAISLLNILQQQDEFVEHKGALLQQALVAERVRLSLTDAPQSGQDALDALSRKLRLTDTEATAAPVATTSTTTAVTSSADEDDWSLLDDIVLKDEPTDDNGTTDTASTDSGAVAVSTDTAAPASHIAAQKTASDDTTTATGESATIALAEDSSATAGDSIAASTDTTATADASTTISLADDSSAATGDGIAASTDATAAVDASATISLTDDSSAATGDSIAASIDTSAATDASTTISLADDSSATTGDSIAAGLDATATTDTSATISLADDSGATTGDSIAAGLDATATTDTSATISLADDSGATTGDSIAASLDTSATTDASTTISLADDSRAATGDSIAAAHTTAATTASVADFSGEENYNKALRTLQRGLSMGEPDADMQAALAETIRRQWQQSVADDPALREAMAQSLLASFQSEGGAQQAQWVADILAQANAAGGAAVPVQPGLNAPAATDAPQHETPHGISEQAYNRMLNTLRRGLAAGADEDMQAVLSDSISRQWLQQGIATEGETRDDIIAHLKTALASEGAVDEATLDAMLAQVPHRVPSVLPEGVQQDSYGVMMETLRAGLDNAAGADMQEMLATAIGNQWQSQNSLQDSAVRAAVAEQMAAVLGGDGHENAALVEAVLNRAAEKARETPAGLNPADYEHLLETLRSRMGEAQNSDAQEAIAASISSQLQSDNQLQDEATRDAIAQRVIAALGGQGETDAAAVEAILERVAVKVAGQQPAALPAGVRPEAYGAMLQTLSGGIAAAQSDAAAAEALAATIGAQWQEPHSLQDAATRAAVAQQISAALGGEADTATVEGVLNRAAAQAAGLPAGVKQEAYGEMLQTLRAGISTAQSDAAAAEALAASIGAQWQEPHSLQDAATRAAVAQQISAALGGEADAATVEGVLNRAAAQAAGLPAGVKQEAYGEMLQTLRAGIGAVQSDAAAAEALAATIGAQWQEQHSLQDAATRAAVAQQISAALGNEADAATVEGVLNRAAAQAAGLPAGVKQEAYGEMLQTLRGGIAAAQSDAAAAEALAATIGAQWQEPHSLQDAATRAAVAQQISAALGGEADAATVEGVLNRAAAQAAGLPADVKQEAYGAMLQTLRGGIAAAQSDEAAAEALAASIGAQWQEPHSLQDAATRAAVAQQISAALGNEADAATVEGVLNRAAAQANALPQGVKQEAYGEMLQTLRAGISAAQSDAAAAEALAATIGAQWQEPHSLQDAATRAAVAQQISAALGGEADAATVEGVLNRAAAQAAGLPTGVKQEAYGEMLQTLRAGISAAQSDAAAAEALAASIGAQWQEPHSLQDAATRAAVAQQISAALGGEADTATVEGVLNRAAAQAAGLPAGVKQEAYGEMLQTLRAGIGAAQSDAAAAEALAATIGAQWQEQHSLQDAATRAAVAQQISAALGGEADAATVEGVLNRAAAQAAGLPAGVKQEAYGEMLQTLRGNIAAAQSDAAAAEALAASIGAQWQEPHSLQDAATRAAVAQQISVALGGEADTATIESVLNRAAAQAAGLPAGVKQEAYGEMLQTLRGNIAAAQSDAAAAEALAASIGAQWQEPHSLQDATTRAAVAQQISAALGGEADAATVEGVLNRAAAQAAGLPAGVKQEAYGEMLQTLRAGISAAQSDAAAAEALAASIGAQWQEPHSLQDAATRAAVAQQISAALGNEADVATVEGVLNRAAAQAVGLPQGVKHDAYSEMLQTMRSEFAAAQGDEAATEALATMLAAQWEEPHSLQDPAARAVVAAKISAALGGEVDAAAVEDVLARAAVQAAALPEGVKHEAYGEMLQTLRAGLTASHGDSAVAQEMLAASIGAQWADAYSLHDDTVRATVAARISEALGDKVDAATVAAILDRAVEKAAASALPKELSPEVYNRLLGTLRRGLQDGDADTQAALAATLQRHWEQNGLPQDPATIAAVQQHLGASLAAQGFASQQVDQVFAEAGLQANAPSVVVQAVLPPDAAQDDATTAPQVVDTGFFEVVGDDDAAAGDSAEGGFIDTATVPGDHPPLNDADIVNVPVAFANRPLSGDVQGGAGQAAANSVSIGDLSSILANMPRRVNPAERLSKELASLAQHPGLDDAVSQDKGSEISAAASRAGFLRAVDQFETLSQLADKTESPELIDDLIDAVYDIEDSIDADTAPQWVWRLLDSIEQLLLTHKHEGTPVSLSCAAVLRQSADLIENYEEEANEDDAIDAINSLLNARRELGGGKIHSAPATMPYSGDTLGSELVEDPNANTMLAETFIDEAMSLFAHSQEEAERWDENRSQLSRLDAIRRDIHTLKGSARMAGYNAIGDLTHGVESLIDGIVSGQVEPSSKATSILVGAMWQGMLMLDSVRDGYLPQTDPYILNNIHSYLNQPLPYPDVAEAAEVARLAQQQEAALEAEMRANAAASTLAEEPVVEELPVETDFDDNIDPVLVDIFTDEAQELLQTTSQLLEDDFSKKEVVEELQRTMHTLKGGARLVGFTAIGDTAHLMESVIDKVPELAEGKVRQAKTLLNFGLDAHYDMLDSVLRHEMPQPALEVNESLKTFADSGVFRPPSQKGGDNSDTAPETAEQTPADEAPQAADDAGGQAQEAGDSSAAPATGAASGSAGGGDSDASASAGSDSAASSGQATHAESAASATHSDHAAAAASSHGDSAAADKAGDGAASAAPSDSQHGGAAADKAGDGSAPAAHGDSQHSGAPADKAGDGAAPAAHGDNQHSGAAADKAGEGAAASGHDKDKGFDGKPEGIESVIEYGNDAQPEKKEEKKPEPARDSNISTDNLPRYVRVDAQLLDEMIAMTGETAIMRSRMENVISEAEFSLNELTRVAARIAEQMRRLDSETEAQLLYRREQQGEDDTHFDPLEMDRFTEIQQLSRQISEAIDDLKNLQDTLSQDNIILRNLSTQQGIIQRSIQDHLLTTQLMRFDVHEARLRRLVKQTAKSVGKDVNFILEGGEVEVERRLLEDILPALEHMIRNSLAHGIEKPEARLATGKPETGTIKLVVSVHAAELSVDLIDDGQGLNYDRIREKAAAKGLLDPERANDEAYLSTLILRSGFSTAESLSQLAGRGVGMDVVNEMVKQRRGQIGVYSLRGKGTQFTLSMPFSMSIAEVLLVEIAGQTFAAPMSSIAAISQVDRDSLQRSFDGETVYQHYNDQDYRQYILGAYFKPEQYSFAVEEQSAPVLFINAGGEPVAFHVDRILNRLEIIVKNVNRQVLNIPGISGATILGDGRVVPVLELLDLSRRIANLTPIHDEVAAAAEARIPNVLVVDDSVTMRKVSTRLLERHHYNVATAKDGLDAIEVLATFTPDIILLDIEMPRMDGFEFASHVRSSSAVSDVPIVMITSRTGDKHRERADAIGVQGYLGKPYSEDVLIQTIEHLLQKRGDL